MRMVIVRMSGYRRHVTTETQPQRVLADLGLRATPQRLWVLEELADEPNGATAQEIHDRLRARGLRIGLATVYRTLAVLAEHGVVDTLAHRPGEACYRLCGADHHHHLVCTNCNRVVELGECDLEPWLDQLGAAHGFRVTAHSVEVSGVCAGCNP
jgi:Fur family transcriptional regulator, ferric uptake regulator